MRRAPVGAAAVVACVAALTACASLAPTSPAPAAASTVDAPFSIGGRISARRGNDGVAGAFTWIHDPRRDAIDLSTPLGQTLARLEGDADGVTVRLQDGRTEAARTWRELTERAFGVTIPIDGLSSWLRGAPRAGAPFTVERDAQGRATLLRQEGWEIVYAYGDDAAQRPFRVSLSYPGAEPVDVRVVVDRWQ